MYYKVTVIVPVYNVENYLKKCLDSLIKQTLQDIEIIAVNDGSTDQSLPILEQYASIYSNIKIITKENGGLSDARNVGIENSNGDYIAFIDSDDWIEKDMMEEMYFLGKKHNADIVFCSLQKVNEYGTVLKKFPQFHKLSEKIILKENFFLFGEIENFACNKIFKKSLFNKINFPKGLHFEDNATIPRLILNSSILAKTNKYFYQYFVRSDSISQNHTSKGLDMLEAIKIVRNDFTISSYKEKSLDWKKFIVFQGFYCFLAYYAFVKDSDVKKLMFLKLRELIHNDNISKKEIFFYKRFNKNYLFGLNIKKIIYYIYQLIKL